MVYVFSTVEGILLKRDVRHNVTSLAQAVIWAADTTLPTKVMFRRRNFLQSWRFIVHQVDGRANKRYVGVQEASCASPKRFLRRRHPALVAGEIVDDDVPLAIDDGVILCNAKPR